MVVVVVDVDPVLGSVDVVDPCDDVVVDVVECVLELDDEAELAESVGASMLAWLVRFDPSDVAATAWVVAAGISRDSANPRVTEAARATAPISRLRRWERTKPAWPTEPSWPWRLARSEGWECPDLDAMERIQTSQPRSHSWPSWVPAVTSDMSRRLTLSGIGAGQPDAEYRPDGPIR